MGTIAVVCQDLTEPDVRLVSSRYCFDSSEVLDTMRYVLYEMIASSLWVDEAIIPRSMKISRQKHKNPHNEYIRKAYQQKLREYKQLCNKKRNEFWNCQITKLQDNLQKESFWNTWEDFDECIRKETVAIKDGHTWESYFKKLLSSTTNDKPPPPPHGLSRPDTLLNSRIKQEEISNAINKLKNGKSAGADAINNEMIKHSTPELQQLICKIFNVFISNGRLPKELVPRTNNPYPQKG